MPNIAQIKRIIQNTPTSQNILLVGDHGIGKSEILSSIFAGQMKVVTLFLGQNSDIGDIIGIPYHETVTVNGTERTITRFAPPEWWPIDGKPIVLFLDEPNRGKTEVMNGIMDLLLNKKLRDLILPEGSRIIGAMNPMKDGFYQVEDLDPAFLDRWNVYEFKPDVSEWLDWAYSNDVHKYVTSFIENKPSRLYPPSSDKHKAGDITTSARSWKRISDILSRNVDICNDVTFLQDLCVGIIGLDASVDFRRHVNEYTNAIGPEKVLEHWTKTLADKINKMSVTDVTNLCDQLIIWLRHKEAEMDNKESLKKWATNLGSFVAILSEEIQMHLISGIGTEMHANKRSWPKLILSANKEGIAMKFAEFQKTRLSIESKNGNSSR